MHIPTFHWTRVGVYMRQGGRGVKFVFNYCKNVVVSSSSVVFSSLAPKHRRSDAPLALHLLCRDAGFLHDAGMMVMAGLCVCSVLLLAAVRVRVPCERFWVCSTPTSPLACAYALHLLGRDAVFLQDAGMMVLAWLAVCSVVVFARCWRW